MPIIRCTVEASTKPTAVEAWACTLCSRTTIHMGPLVDPAELLEYFTSIGWRLLPGDEPVCERCKKHPDIANVLLAHERVRGLQ